ASTQARIIENRKILRLRPFRLFVRSSARPLAGNGDRLLEQERNTFSMPVHVPVARARHFRLDLAMQLPVLDPTRYSQLLLSLDELAQRQRTARKIVVCGYTAEGREMLRALALAGRGWIGF